MSAKKQKKETQMDPQGKKANKESKLDEDLPTLIAKLKKFEEELEVLKLAESEAKDKMLRAVAESQNVQKRAQKEKEEFQRYMLSRFAGALLPVADNLRRALEAAEGVSLDEVSKNIVQGVEGTEKELLKVFESFKIVPFSDLGKPFDPNRHRVVFEQEDDSKEPGTILQVVQKGYMIGDRLLREAMVGVSKKAAVEGKSDEDQKIDKKV